jgi:4-diphosphocytidyl-2-C-methyl-D-erythritol kinase
VSGVVVKTAAKVNLCLRVLGRRTDGYHDIESVFHTVGVWDRVHLAPLSDAGRVTLEVSSGEAPADESNLCWRAAALLAERARPGLGVAIRLEKEIPTQAGLGGGSADAAAALVGLMRLWKLSLPTSTLAETAAELGADVPFFLRGGCCLARGRGEKLEECPAADAWLVVVVPQARVLTGQAYAVLQRGSASGRRQGLTRATQRVVDALKAGDVASLAGALQNDFEAAALPGIAQAREAKEDLIRAGCLGAALSGSGSAAFGIAGDRASAARAAGELQDRWAWVRVAPTVTGGESLAVSGAEGE